MRLKPASELTSRTIDWLWPGRLALGKLAMLDGDPGLGKSLVALDLCAHLSTGRPFPDDSPGPGPCNTLILNAEDGARDTIRPRLQAMGADLVRVFVVDGEDLDRAGPLRLPGQMALLDGALARTKSRLMVLDPVVAFLDASICDRSDQAVRRALMPLARLAERRRCAVMMVRHLNKKGKGRALYRGSGSIGFLGACRSGWLVARDPDELDHRVLAQVKNNLAPPQPSLAFQVEAPEGSAPRLNWLGPSPRTADELLMTGPSPATGPALDRTVSFLAGLLEGGPCTSREIWEASRQEGMSERTLYRARQELQVRVERVMVEKRRLNYWLLPGQRLPDGLGPEAVEADLEQWLAPLREQFPPSTPLDEL